MVEVVTLITVNREIRRRALVSMTQEIMEVTDCFRADVRLDVQARKASWRLLAAGDLLIAAMEQERKFDNPDLHDEWVAQRQVVDGLAGQYLEALTECRTAAERIHQRAVRPALATA